MDFIDIEGASGARYRFRLWPEGAAHPPTPGNYLVVRRSRNGGVSVLFLGECIDLSRVPADWPRGDRRSETLVFTRLNVPRSVREADHRDLAAHWQTCVQAAA